MSKRESLLSFTRRTLLASALALVALVGRPASAADNPMAWVGQDHNIILACIIDNDPQSQFDPFHVIIDICLFNAGMTAEEFSATYTPLMPADLLAPMDAMMRPHRGQFSDAQYAYILETERILSTETPEAAAKALEALEARAVTSLGREAADVAVLAGLSTARHSLYFWTVERPWETGGTAKKAKWWQVVLADVAGAIVGGLFGGGVGAVGLGSACSAHVASL